MPTRSPQLVSKDRLTASADAPPEPRAAAPDAIETIAFVSLGCPKNLVDSERMLGLLAEDGIAITPDAADADAVVINTCGFLEASREESLNEIRAALALKTIGRVKRVIVAGCLVQRHKTKLLADVPGVDRLVGVFDREHIVAAVRGEANQRQAHGHYLGKYHDLSRVAGRELRVAEKVAGGELRVASKNEATSPATRSSRLTTSSPTSPATRNPQLATSSATSLPVFEDDRSRLRLTPRHYAYLRMSEGCNQGCSFCTIPSIRGPLRSKPIEQILAEARELAADGAVELNLIGQDTTSYGTDSGYAPGLAGLLRKLNRQMKDVHWLRLMYAYPSCFTDDMMDAIADCDRVVKYIDMPLQHINDAILKMMRRRVTRDQIVALLEKLRRRVPGIAIRTTFIAGSPGETDAQHAELVKFVRDFGFGMMGVFPFSPEPGTAMGRLSGQIPDDVKQSRVEELMLAQQEVVFERSKRMKGKTIEVMIERPAGRDAEDGWVARGQGQAPDIDSVVFVHSTDRLHPGQFVDVTVTDYQAYDLIAEVPKLKTRTLNVLAER